MDLFIQAGNCNRATDGDAFYFPVTQYECMRSTINLFFGLEIPKRVVIPFLNPTPNFIMTLFSS
jgi:hypothetical protein